MYCKYCGKEINDNAVVCVHCGVPTGDYKGAQQANAVRQQPTNTLAIVGFVLSFCVAIAGLICSIIAYKNAPQYNGNGKGLATAGIIISCVEMLAVLVPIVIYVVIYIVVWMGIWGAISFA